jgi:SAM-dependent methyltransferase
MAQAYEGYIDWKLWTDETFGRFSQEDMLYFAAETGLHAPAKVRVLELGFGNGAVLGWLRSIGADVFAVELNPVLVQRGRKLLGEQNVFGDMRDEALTARAGTFDCIVSFDVVEHLPHDELATLLVRMRELLTSNGRIILRFPNGDSPLGRIYQHGDPTHVTTIGKYKLEYWAGRAGLEVQTLRAPAMPTRGGGLARWAKRSMMLFVRRVVERGFAYLYFDKSVVPFHPLYVAVLVRR